MPGARLTPDLSVLKFWPTKCDIHRMILLIWSSDRAQECANAIEGEFEQPVRIVSNLDQACEALKSSSFSAVLLDQWMYEGSPGKADLVFQHLGAAVPVIVNFATNAMDRVVRTLRSALEQRKREMNAARQNARVLLLGELKDELTALLLACGMALREPALSAQASGQIRTIEEIANRIRQKLLAEKENQASVAARAGGASS
jgi:hypothetical protein